MLVFGGSLVDVAAKTSRQEVKRSYDQTFVFREGQKLQIRHRLGQVRVSVGDSDHITFHADIRVSAEEEESARRFADAIKFDVQESAASLGIATEYPEQKSSFWSRLFSEDVSYSADLEISMPETMPLEIENAFGAVRVTGLKADADVATNHGPLEFSKGVGTIKLRNAFGSIDLTDQTGDAAIVDTNAPVTVVDVRGNLTLENRFGDVEVRTIGKTADIRNSNGTVTLTDVGERTGVINAFGPVKASEIKGPLQVTNQNGTIEVRTAAAGAELTTTFGTISASDVTGRLECRGGNGALELSRIAGSVQVSNSFGPVTLTDVQGNLDVESRNGSISVKGVGGPAHLETTFGSIKAEQIRGDLTALNANGGVEGLGIDGSADVRTRFGGVTLRGVGGAITVDNNNGSVVVEDLSASRCVPITLQTTFAPMKITLPSNGTYNLEAHTSFGKIRSGFPVTVKGVTGENSLVGTIGKGGCRLELTNQNGSIDIEKGP